MGSAGLDGYAESLADRLVRHGGDDRGTGGQDHDDSSKGLHVERVYIQIPNREKGVVECKRFEDKH